MENLHSNTYTLAFKFTLTHSLIHSLSENTHTHARIHN